MQIKEKLLSISQDLGSLKELFDLALNSSNNIKLLHLVNLYNKGMKELHSFEQWNNSGRYILPYSKGHLYYENNTKKYVFDISQTKGLTKAPKKMDIESFERIYNGINKLVFEYLENGIEDKKEQLMVL